jgi:hypothetical protein
MIDSARLSFNLHVASGHSASLAAADTPCQSNLNALSSPSSSPRSPPLMRVCRKSVNCGRPRHVGCTRNRRERRVRHSARVLAGHLHCLIKPAGHNKIGLCWMVPGMQCHDWLAAAALAGALDGVDCVGVPFGQMHGRRPLARVPNVHGLQGHFTSCAGR